VNTDKLKFIQKIKKRQLFKLVSIGNYKKQVMPFDFCNALATFERTMEQILKDYLFKIFLVYLKDVIFDKSFEEMLLNLEKIFHRLRKANLKIDPQKCFL